MQDVTMEDLLVVSGGALAMLAFVMLWLFRPEIVSIVSGIWQSIIAESRDRRAYRQSVYGAKIMSRKPPSAPVPAPVPVPVPGVAPVPLAALASNLTERDYIELGARLRDARGNPVFSGNTLYKIAGGNHDEFLADMRRWRGDDDDEEPPTPRVIMMRDNGLPPRPVPVDPDFPYQPMEKL